MLSFYSVHVRLMKKTKINRNNKWIAIIAIASILCIVLLILTNVFSLFLTDHFDTENGMIEYDGTWINGYIPRYYNDHMEIDWLIDGYTGQYVACDWRFEITIRSPSGQSYSTTYQCQVPEEYYLGDDYYAITTDFGSNKKFSEVGEWDITRGELIAKVENDWVTLDRITDGDNAIAVDYSTEWQVSTFSATPPSINSGETVSVSYSMVNIGDIPSTNCYRIFCDLNGNQYYDNDEKTLVYSYIEDAPVGEVINGEKSTVLTSDDAVDGTAYITLEFTAYNGGYNYHGLSITTVEVIPVLPPSIGISTDSTVVVVSTGIIALLGVVFFIFRKLIFRV